MSQSNQSTKLTYEIDLLTNTISFYGNDGRQGGCYSHQDLLEGGDFPNGIQDYAAYLERLGYRHGNPIEEKPATDGRLHDLLQQGWPRVKADPNAAMIARDGEGTSYEGRAFCDGKWLPWHSISQQVFNNRQRWPRDGYEVRRADERAEREFCNRLAKDAADDLEQVASTAKPALASLISSPDLAGEWKPFEFGSAHLKG